MILDLVNIYILHSGRLFRETLMSKTAGTQSHILESEYDLFELQAYFLNVLFQTIPNFQI